MTGDRFSWTYTDRPSVTKL